jgi:hypothetical protein
MEDDEYQEKIESAFNHLYTGLDLIKYTVSSNYLEDFEKLEEAINSINNKLCITSQK